MRHRPCLAIRHWRIVAECCDDGAGVKHCRHRVRSKEITTTTRGISQFKRRVTAPSEPLMRSAVFSAPESSLQPLRRSNRSHLEWNSTKGSHDMACQHALSRPWQTPGVLAAPSHVASHITTSAEKLNSFHLPPTPIKSAPPRVSTVYVDLRMTDCEYCKVATITGRITGRLRRVSQHKQVQVKDYEFLSSR